MLKVVVNSTPLIVLCNIGMLSLLKEMYGEIIIPEAVYKEITAKMDSACIAVNQSMDWIKILKIPANEKLKIYRARLHAGEVEVMLLAQQLPVADLVIIDDNAAKTTAKFLGLKVTGTLGVLLKAKKLGLISSIRPLIEKIVQSGFYISDNIKNIILHSAGE